VDPAPTPTIDDAAGPGEGGALDDIEATGARRRHRKRSSTRNMVEWLAVIAGALVVAVIVKTFLVQAFYIPSGSMEPTLQVGDRVLVEKIGYDLADVHRGDIVVFERPDNWQAGPNEIDDLIKRVIGLPGERIEVRDGFVFINGVQLDEPWGEQGPTPDFLAASGCSEGCTIPEGDIFVLGDNRNNSSASNQYGPLPFDEVVGKAFIRVWPFSDFGGL
jgi:signal peptidase I